MTHTATEVIAELLGIVAVDKKTPLANVTLPIEKIRLIAEAFESLEQQLSEAREALSLAEEYVSDGVTYAKSLLEMYAPYPSRAPRYQRRLDEVLAIHERIRAVLASALYRPERQI